MVPTGQDASAQTDRRGFLRTALAAACAMPSVAAGYAADRGEPSTAPATRPAASGDRWSGSIDSTQPSTKAGGVDYWDKATRLTISMWDFSWLLDGQPGGTFADLERCVAGARERGYNTLRVDCFVAHQLQNESKFERNYDGNGLPKWGMTRKSFATDVRARVAELARLCRKHEIWLGLDSWKSTPGGGATPEKMEGVFTRFGEKWARALRQMREDGVLERAVWVAPLNEAPLFLSMTVPSVKELISAPLREGLTELEKTQDLDALYRRINGYMAGPIKAELASDGIPICYSSLSAEDYAGRLTDDYDVVDVHFMPAVITDNEDRAALEAAGKGTGGFPRWAELQGANLKAFSAAWDNACRKNYAAMLRRAYVYHAEAMKHLTLSSGKRLQAIITESFGPCYWPVHPDVNQGWYKRYNADALRMIASLPISGSSISNYAEPLFGDLWNDIEWQWTANQFFLSQAEAAARAIS